jgi:hypothetical protein
MAQKTVPLLLFHCCLADRTENHSSVCRLLPIHSHCLATATVELLISRSLPSNGSTFHIMSEGCMLDVGGHNCRCRVNCPLNFPRDRLWGRSLSGGGRVPQTAGRRPSEFFSEYSASRGQTRTVVNGCPISKEEDGRSCILIFLVRCDFS